MISLGSFAEGRNVKSSAVATYIRRHKEQFKGLTKRDGNKLLLSDEAVLLLDEIYPVPKPIEVIVDTETQRELIDAYKLIDQLRVQISEMQGAIAIAEAQKMLLEDKKAQLEEQKERTQKAELELEKYKPTLFGLYRKEK